MTTTKQPYCLQRPIELLSEAHDLLDQPSFADHTIAAIGPLLERIALVCSVLEKLRTTDQLRDMADEWLTTHGYDGLTGDAAYDAARDILRERGLVFGDADDDDLWGPWNEMANELARLLRFRANWSLRNK